MMRVSVVHRVASKVGRAPVARAPGWDSPSARRHPARTLSLLLLLAAASVLFSLGSAGRAQAATILTDDFEAAFAGWTLGGTPDWHTGDPRNGTHSIRLRGTESIERTVSTVCYQNITVSFSLGAQSLESAETVRALWYDGGTWNVLKAIANGDPEEDGLLHYFAYSLPAGAANNANFAVRFELNGSNIQDFGYVDDVLVQGDIIQYTLSLDGTNGSVTVNGIPQSLPWSGSFNCGSVVNLAAVPDSCYGFTGWSGDLGGVVNPTTITMDGNKSVTANFTILQYTLSLDGTNGSVTVNGTPQALPWSGSFNCGSVVNLTAVPGACQQFDAWSGDLTGTTPSTSITMNANKAVTASFSQAQYTLNLTGSGNGQVSVNGTLRSLPWIEIFACGSVVNLTAVPASGWEFVNWTGDASWSGSTIAVTLSANKDIVANFAAKPTLTIAENGSGSVRVDGVLHALPWSGTFLSGTSVALEAVPDAGWTFDGWSGDATWSGSQLTVTMDASKNITATFSQDGQVLNLSKIGNGSAKVNGTLQALPWSGSFLNGTLVALEAVPDAGWVFDGWSGDATWSGSQLTVTMDASKNITATFSQVGYVLDLSKVGSGSVKVDGTLRSLPWSDTFALGAEVTLEAVPDTGWYFAGWAGDASGIANPIAVTMDTDRSITATFTQTLYALNVSAVGNGSIEVNGSSVVLPYSGSVPYGGTVTLEAVPEYGWRFTGWSGSVVGTDNPVVVMVNDELDITATFVLPDTYFLTITKAGSGAVSVNGTLVSLPWIGEFARNAEVVIEAAIEGDQEFYGWSGDASGTDMSVPLTMDADKAVSAEFMCISIFPDVPCDHWAAEAIEAVHNADIANGYSDGLYLPDLAVTRAAMAVFIARGLAGGTEGVPTGPEEPTFPDVPPDHWAYSSVEYTAANNVVEGYPSGTYQPAWQVNRAQMAVFIARSIVTPTGEAGLEPYEAPEVPTFNDVPTNYWSYKHVEYLVENGTVVGYPDGLYRPSKTVTRDQMAVYLGRCFDLLD
jgi:uncharacterized repeat protein (TIGR02543 family)